MLGWSQDKDSCRLDTITVVPTLRLFAQAREAAGMGSIELSGNTVDDILRVAEATFGENFAHILANSKVWVNGEEVPRSHPLTDKDEVAVLPPVSGGM